MAQPTSASPALGERDANVACPPGRISIYFASGDVQVSQPADELIGLVSERATACQADGLDIIARIDARVDGDGALALALQRLSDVAGGLVARGVPASGLRIAAQAAPTPDPASLNHVDIIFRKDAPTDPVAGPSRPQASPRETI